MVSIVKHIPLNYSDYGEAFTNLYDLEIFICLFFTRFITYFANLSLFWSLNSNFTNRVNHNKVLLKMIDHYSSPDSDFNFEVPALNLYNK